MSEEEKNNVSEAENKSDSENVVTENRDAGSFYSRHKKLCKVSIWCLSVLVFLLIFLGPIVGLFVELLSPVVAGVPVKIGSMWINFFTGNISINNIRVGDAEGLNSEQFIKIRRVDVKVYNGWAEVNDIAIANPKGFKEPHIFVLKTARVDIDPGSLTSEKLEVEEFFVTGLNLYYEPQAGGKNNIDKLQEYVIEKFNLVKNKEDKKKDDKEEKKLQVDELRLTDINVHTVVMGQTLMLPVIPIELDDLGEGPEGVTGGDVFLAVLDRLSMGATSAIAEQMKVLGIKTIELFGTVGTHSKEAVDGAGKKMKSGLEGLKKLFGNKEKK